VDGYDDDDDRDAPQEIDLERETDDRVECSRCGASVWEEAPRCPNCGYWLSEESSATDRSRRWLWPMIVAVLIAVILVMWHGLGR